MVRRGNTTRQHKLGYMDGSCNSHVVYEESRRTGFLKPIAEVLVSENSHEYSKEKNEKATHEDSKEKSVSVVNSLKACAKERNLIQGTKIHADIRNSGLLERNTYIRNTLVSMYAKCGAVDKAQQVLDEMPVRQVVSWNALIAGYAQEGMGQEALSCFERMQNEGIVPSAITYTCTLKACSIMQDIERGKRIHEEVVSKGLLGRDTILGNALVDMYAKCGAVYKAAQVLDEMPVQVIVSWNSLIAGYVQQGLGEEALQCYEHMQSKGFSPNALTYTCILKACGITKDVERGKQIHDRIVTQGLFGIDVVLDNALVDMYAKCGVITKAQQVLADMSVRNVASWNSFIAGLAKQGQSKEALNSYDRMRMEGLLSNAITYTCSLSACGITGDIERGKQIHNEIAMKSLLSMDAALGNSLVDMYAKCGEFQKALRLLDELPVRDAVSWSSLIAGYVRQGLAEEAINSFERMQWEGVMPDASTYTTILKAYGSMQDAHKGKLIHDEIASKGLLKTDPILSNALVDMYAKCCAVGKAQVIDELPMRGVISWNGLIAGYAQCGLGEEALSSYERMLTEGFSPDAITYLCVLKACGIIQNVIRGQNIHYEIISQGLLRTDVPLGNALVDMYAKCGALAKAHEVLGNLPARDVASWNALITGYAQQGLVKQAMDCYEWMETDGVSPDAITCSVILKTCGMACDVEKGGQIFENIISKGLLEIDVIVGNALLDMYAKCGAIIKAQRLLDEMPIRDVISWNALISGYVYQDQGQVAMDRFQQMQMEGVTPNAITYTYILKACGITQDAGRGRQIHGEIANQALLGIDSVLGNALLDMYGKCGASEEALQVIEELPVWNVCSWSALIAGYVLQGNGKGALECYERMLSEGVSPNAITYTCILKACAMTQEADMGKKIHDEIVMQQLLEGNVVLGNALINMYTECGVIVKAEQLLNGLSIRDEVSWSTVMAGYALHGYGRECLECYEQIQSVGLSPDAITYTHILKACSMTQDIHQGQKIHDEIVKKGFVLHDALAEMYVECGSMASSQQLLKTVPVQDVLSSPALITQDAQPGHCGDSQDCIQRMQRKGVMPNMVSWNALLVAYIQQGLAEEALRCFQLMKIEGISPDANVFALVLKACGHLGLVNEGQIYFKEMRENYGILPNKHHYTSMVKIFGHAGHLDNALAVIKQMPSSCDPPVWFTLLGASQRWGNSKLGRLAFESAVKLIEGDFFSNIQG